MNVEMLYVSRTQSHQSAFNNNILSLTCEAREQIKFDTLNNKTKFVRIIFYFFLEFYGSWNHSLLNGNYLITINFFSSHMWSQCTCYSTHQDGLGPINYLQLVFVFKKNWLVLASKFKKNYQFFIFWEIKKPQKMWKPWNIIQNYL